MAGLKGSPSQISARRTVWASFMKICGSTLTLSAPRTWYQRPPPYTAISLSSRSLAPSPTETVEIVMPEARRSLAMRTPSESEPMVCPSVTISMCLTPASLCSSSRPAISMAGNMFVPPPGRIERICREIEPMSDSRVRGTIRLGEPSKATTTPWSRRLSVSSAAMAASLAICCCDAPVAESEPLMEPDESITRASAPMGICRFCGGSRRTGSASASGEPIHPPAPKASGPPILTSPPPVSWT